jgi:predicted CXXCH cytochrome family protein
LWKHATTTKSFTMYDSPSFDGHSTQTAQPSGASKACLSCHDGSLAVNQSFDGSWFSGSVSGGVTNAQYVGVSRQIAADGNLTTTHPISFDYNDVASKDPEIYPASTTLAFATGDLAGKTVAALLKNGRMECSSCHDPHKTKGYAPSDSFMRVIRNDYSELCRSCHNK